MPLTTEIADDEVLIRRVPPGETWQKLPGPVPTSVNVRLRPEETGLSVSRASITTPERLLELAGASFQTGWLVMAARVRDLREFGLRVVGKPTDDDPGHAEIEPAGIDLSSKKVCRELVKLFSLISTEKESE